MRIFLAGGTGAIGRPLLGRLLAGGHHVTVLTRSAERAGAIQGGGAEAVVGDATDADVLRKLVADANPDVVINQLTSLSKSSRPKSLREGFTQTGRLRTEVSATLVQAAVAAGARRVIAQSIAFAYCPGPGVRTEDDPLYLDASPQIRTVVGAVADLERATTTNSSIEGVVLRYGAFYGPATYYDRDGMFTDLISKRRLPIAGKGRGVFGFVHVDDAASATVAALAGPVGTYNVTDGVDAPTAEWLPYLAGLIGAKPPRRMPIGLVRLAAGAYTAYLLDEQPSVSNARAVDRLGWTPAHPSWREGFAALYG